MLGLLALGLTAIMIYTLVKNALLGKQLSKDDEFSGSIEMIVPVLKHSEFFLEAWPKTISTQLKVHVLVDGHHPSLVAWQELKTQIPYLEIHSFPMRPTDVEAIPWMLDQVAGKISSSVVIIGDPELTPTEHAFLSIARSVTEKKRSYFIVPQTAKFNHLGEAISVLNPTLAFASFFGFKKWRRNVTHPLLSNSQGWMAMSFENFKALDFKSPRITGWKEMISRQWEEQKKIYHLAFGEKLILRYYPKDLKAHAHQLRTGWEVLWNKKDKLGFWLFIVTLFLWSFPFVCFLTHPFQAIASFFLLVLYRFFSKIVFQESWWAIMLHPVACLFWIGTLGWFVSDEVKAKYFAKQNQGTN